MRCDFMEAISIQAWPKTSTYRSAFLKNTLERGAGAHDILVPRWPYEYN